MIAWVEFPYGENGRKKLAELAKDELVRPQLAEIFGSLMPSVENQDQEYYWPEHISVDMDTEGLLLGNLGVHFTVKKYKGTFPVKAILPDRKEPVTVYVQVPHIGLLAMNEVEVLEDCCTDRLQTQLDRGWRILCVCPPNAARRPDYIMGRTRPEEDR